MVQTQASLSNRTRVAHRLTGTVANPSSLTVIPQLLADCCNTMEAWGKGGRLDPFPSIYHVSSSIPQLVPNRSTHAPPSLFSSSLFEP